MKGLKNWTGTTHYSVDGVSPACGRLATADTWLAPTDEPVTCQRCLVKHGQMELEALPASTEVDYVALRAAERAARQAAREKLS